VKRNGPPPPADMSEGADLPRKSGIEPVADTSGFAEGSGPVGRRAGRGDGDAAGAQRDVAAAKRDVAAAKRDVAAAKRTLRADLLARRRGLTAEQRATAGHLLRDAVLAAPETQMAGTVAAYVSVGTEPDSRGLIFALWKRGTYVLLPLLRADGDLDWASYEGPESLAQAPRGLLEPTEPARGVTAITSADLVIAPALAVDSRGMRLGRGGGSYDRALARVAPSILTIALLYDGELLEQVPSGPRDVAVRAAALPAAGISRLG
jgi:5-formyltetrahydrofolate cyclo-ligase